MTVAVDHPSGVEIRHLTALAAVAEEGSFRRAATRLGYVQSAISEQIAALERIVGQQLIVRSRGAGAVELTDAGEVLLAHANAILARVKAAEADLDAVADGTAASLRLGIYQSVGARIVPRLLPRYARDWPNVRVLPRESPTDAGLFELVERGELELSFADLPLHAGPFESLELMDDPYVLVVSADSPLAGAQQAGLDQVADLPLIGHWTCRVLPRVEAELRAQGVEPNFVFRSDIIGTVQALVGAGVGNAIVPRLAVDFADRQVSVVELGADVPVQPRVIALFWHGDRYRSPAALGFVESAREVCAQVTAELDGVVRPLRRTRSA
jgi:DNA-binding transcriptional LysR family regulator